MKVTVNEKPFEMKIADFNSEKKMIDQFTQDSMKHVGICALLRFGAGFLGAQVLLNQFQSAFSVWPVPMLYGMEIQFTIFALILGLLVALGPIMVTGIGVYNKYQEVGVGAAVLKRLLKW